jgi:hypothetical protein
VSRLAKFAAIVSALGLLWVLITPALDELPCTAGHKLFAVSALLPNAAPFVLQPFDSDAGFTPHTDRPFGVADVLSLTCVSLC